LVLITQVVEAALTTVLLALKAVLAEQAVVVMVTTEQLLVKLELLTRAAAEVAVAKAKPLEQVVLVL
jgi:hypothetical protein